MGTLLGGDRWNDEMSPLNDDWYSWKTEQKRKENPLDMDYVPEKHREVYIIGVDLAKEDAEEEVEY